MVHVSDAAARQIQRLLREEGRSDAFIRVRVKSGGCSGLSYDFGFVDAPEEGDQTFEEHGVKMLVEKKSLLYLLGTTLDFSGGLNGKGFVFNNPNAARTCGCGESFAV